MKHASTLAMTVLPLVLVTSIHQVGPPPAELSRAPIARPITDVQLDSRSDPIVVTSVTGGTEQQRALATWALGRYRSAGLEIPVLAFHLHADESSCQGNSGFFSPSSRPWRIVVCSVERMVFLHEIGHAWAEHNLTEAERTAFVEQRGMESWNSPGTSWRARGSEDAANTLAWGLRQDGSIRSMILGGPIAKKNDAFRLLTGTDAPITVSD